MVTTSTGITIMGNTIITATTRIEEAMEESGWR
jgi:hypothetical protein